MTLRRICEFLSAQRSGLQAFLKDVPDPEARQFMAHNRRVWRGYRSDTSQGEILIEANRMGGCNTALSYVASYLGRAERAKLVVFHKGLSRADKTVYRSFADSFHQYSARAHEAEMESLFQQIYPWIKTKRDLEELRVDEFWIGDLVYDKYIRHREVTTVDIGNAELAAELREALGYLIHWRKYFASHRVKAVLVGHCVFPWAGVITRVAVEASVPVYLVQMNRLYYIDRSHNSRPYNEYVDHPRHFARLSDEHQARARAEARERVAKRLRGERDVGLHHLLNPTHGAASGKRVLAESPRMKVVVASHCFSDDNHVYGNNLFPDFNEWLLFLGTISERTDYDWYIKLHPDRYPWETKHIEAFVERFPKFTILPSDTPHGQIKADGVSCVLTVYGTIGFEYAAMGIPVVTASLWNPTVAYDFNVHPKTVAEYERTLMNLGNLKVTINLDRVYEYYYCQYIDVADDWLYDDFGGVYGDLAASQGVVGSRAYTRFLEEFTDEKHRSILETVERFVRSGDYNLRPLHFSPARARSGYPAAPAAQGDL